MGFRPAKRSTPQQHLPWRDLVKLPRAKTGVAALLDDTFQRHPILWPAGMSIDEKKNIVNWSPTMRAETFHDWLKECRIRELLTKEDLDLLVDEMLVALYPQKTKEEELVIVAT